MKKFKNAEEYNNYRYSIQDKQQREGRYVPYTQKRHAHDKDSTKKSEIEPEIQLRDFNFATRPVQSIKKFDWEKGIKAVAISQQGKQGVIFIESDEGAIVVKGSSDVAVDYFLYKLQRVLNVNVPQMKVCRWYDDEFKNIVKSLGKATLCDETLGRRVSSRIDMAFLQIQEYIPGISILGMGPHRAAQVFDHVTPESRDRLIRLGMIIAFDTLINNSDRYPLLWETEGNTDNILINVKTTFLNKTEQLRDPKYLNFNFGQFYALDSGLSCVNTKTEQGQRALQKYFTKLENFLNELFLDIKAIMNAEINPMTGTGSSGECRKINSINSITNFIYQNTLYQMDDMQILQIMLGIIVGVENAYQFGVVRIEEMYEKFFLQEKDDWRGYWNENLRRINLQMYKDCIIIYSKFITDYADVIKWVKDITLNQYHIRMDEFENILQGKFDEEIIEQIQPEIEQLNKSDGDIILNQLNENSKDKILPVDIEQQPYQQQQDAGILIQNDYSINKNEQEVFNVDLDYSHEQELKGNLSSSQQNLNNVDIKNPNQS